MNCEQIETLEHNYVFIVINKRKNIRGRIWKCNSNIYFNEQCI
jgi:hypothetical protein